jgi:hypothetical protein
LARIVTPGAANDGMSHPETPDVGSNAYWNNNIAWKNIQVYDIHAGSQLVACVIVRNMQKKEATIKLQINNQEQENMSFFSHGALILRLHDKLYSLWKAGGSKGDDIEDLGNGKIRLKNEKAWIGNIKLQKEEQYEVCLDFKVMTVPDAGTAFHVNLEQVDNKGFLGGEQFKLKYHDESPGRQTKPSVSYNSVKSEYTISPNPMHSDFSISATNGTTENFAYLYDIMGQVMYKEKFGNKTNIHISNLPDGIYMLKIISEHNHYYYQKLIKN